MPKPPPAPPRTSRKFWALSLVLIIGLGFLVYANSLQGDFLWDDETLIETNPYIKSWSQAGRIFTSRLGSVVQETGAFYRPIQTLSYLLDYSFWRLNPLGYHLSSVAWHIAAALGVFVLTELLFQRGALSLLTALLFVVHPVHTEAVAYVAGRADPMVTCFLLFALVFYDKYTTERAALKTLAGMGLCFVLALGAKDLAIIFPLLVVFYHYALKKPVRGKALITVFGILALYALWRLLVIGTAAIAEGETPTLGERLPGVFVALANYFRLLVVPTDLHMEYGGILFPYGEPKAIIGFVLFVLTAAGVWARKTKDPFLFFAAGWFYLTLLPSSNLLMAINAYMAEHWLYLPAIGFCLLVARLLVAAWEKPQYKVAAAVAAVVLLGYYSTLTVLQNRFWNNDVSFYQKMLKYAPESSRLYNNLAKAYHDAGRDDDLIEILKSAIQLQPDNILAYNNLGNAYKESGRYEEAKRSYQKAIELAPNHAGPYYNLSIIYSDIDGNTEEAARLLKEAIEISPDFSKAYNKLGLIYVQRGEQDQAIALLEKALKLDPDDPEVYHNFGYIYFNAGYPQKAEEMYLRAIEAAPNYAEAYYNLAVIYAQTNEYQKAIGYCDKAAALGYVDQRLLEILKPYR